MKAIVSYIISVTLIMSTISSCTKEFTENIQSKISPSSIIIDANYIDFVNQDGKTRSTYSNLSLTFENGDQIGVYAVDGTSAVASNVCFTWNGTEWVGATEVEYNEDYDYYAYYPYVASPYTPDFTQAATNDIFAAFIADASDKFHFANQSTKANFNASDLMIVKGTHLTDNIVKFSMEHKKGLCIFDGAGIFIVHFSGDNIPCYFNNKYYYLLKPNTGTTLIDDITGSNLVYSLSGKYTTQNIKLNYLTFFAQEDGTFSFSKDGLSYSLDDGETWTALAAGDNTPTVTAGSRVMWKNNTTLTPTSSDGIGTFSSTGTFDAKGNIMSLFYNDDITGKIDLSDKSYAFYGLFQNSKIVNAHYLELPATTLASYCYRNMFKGCTALTTAPSLPATTLASYCYRDMFNGCTALTTAPSLPATTLASYCYYGIFQGCTALTTAPTLPATTLDTYCYENMFSGCTSLTTAPELPATTLKSNCYNGMFRNCTSLTSAPELPATTLATYCYYNMFDGCRKLTTAPELPATTLYNYCYYYMFYGCRALTTAPELPATTLKSNCYNSMFRECTSLTTAPELPARTLITNCYSYMFYGCSKLNYVKAAFTTTPSSSYSTNWLSGTKSGGTFYKNSAASWDVRSNTGVPTSWTIITYTP